MRAPNELVARVGALVEHHLAPALFIKNGATAKGYRRLARKLGAAGVSAELLARVARSDHFGRTTPDALAREFPAGDEFLTRVRELSIAKEAPRDVVLGRHLIARGMKPGPGVRRHSRALPRGPGRDRLDRRRADPGAGARRRPRPRSRPRLDPPFALEQAHDPIDARLDVELVRGQDQVRIAAGTS